MTNKQQQILKTSYRLFTKEGYHATSTSRIAKQAGVSEGLIFRHFKNKDGLLEVIINELELFLNTTFSQLQEIEEAQHIIKTILEIPFTTKDSDIENWKLIFKLNWELNHKQIKTFESLESLLIKAFEKLRYRNPKLETEFLIQHLNGLMSAVSTNKIMDKKSAKDFLLRKYHLQNE